ncbi:AAA family ATPase [Aeromonas hydrophila]|uniref:ATP-binding protein n=1 Tax=Aeromonas hydrophila TaxID=644 RepID=A0AAD3YLR1_AERHY|nr:ATP-binding protein [Aeromonas hydrophila]HAT6345818.1 ATP-binding protein [Aeromonas hydrophila]
MIESIDFKLAGNTGKRVCIDLSGRNVIITGANGCGKTRFLRQLNNYLQQFLQRQIEPIAQIEQQLASYKNQLNNISLADSSYSFYQSQIELLTKRVESLSNEIMTFKDVELIFSLVNSNNMILRFFDANRLTNQLAANGHIESISNMKAQGKNESLLQDSSDKFERYLVGYYNYGSHVIAREKDLEKSKQIDGWFNKVESDLQNLFEDFELALKYNAEEQVFYIVQNGKDPFRFNNLSSGYSSILSIYADLLMKVELRDIPADQMAGIVLIDEIDAHLHVSIQRKIFSFFAKAFPRIQFIITTHSPFVVQSVNDAIIYDLSKMECLEDLSMYSYESILKGLLGVDSTSNLLNEQLELMAKLIQQRPINKDGLQKVVNLIEPHEVQLDSKSKAFLLLGKNALLDANDGEE